MNAGCCDRGSDGLRASRGKRKLNDRFLFKALGLSSAFSLCRGLCRAAFFEKVLEGCVCVWILAGWDCKYTSSTWVRFMIICPKGGFLKIDAILSIRSSSYMLRIPTLPFCRACSEVPPGRHTRKLGPSSCTGSRQ